MSKNIHLREAQVMTAIKWAAMILLIVDHATIALFDNDPIGRAIGRLAFPLFAYMIAVGLQYSSNPLKYFKRILLFAFISEIPFDLFVANIPFYFMSQNVLFTFAIAMGLYLLVARLNYQAYAWLAAFVAGYVLGELCSVDYGGIGVVTVLTFKLAIYGLKGDKLNARFGQALGCALISFGYVISHSIEIGAPYFGMQILAAFALLILLFSKGVPADFSMASKKYSRLFYLVYPLQFVILWAISIALGWQTLPNVIAVIPDLLTGNLIYF